MVNILGDIFTVSSGKLLIFEKKNAA